MADDVKNNNGTGATNEEDRFELDISGAAFEPILDSKFMFAREFGEIVSNIFKEVFLDWEGCRIVDVQMPGFTTIGLEFYFNHNELPDDGRRYRAITRNIDHTKTNNSTLNGIRRFSNAINNGDRYYLTEDAQKCFKTFLFDNVRGLYGQNGNINWNSAVSETAEPAQNYSHMYGQLPVQQYTSLSKIDPSKIATAIYGDDTGEAGAKWYYQVVPVNSIPVISQFGMTNNIDPASRILRIDRVSETELNKLATKLGFTNFGNKLNIIR